MELNWGADKDLLAQIESIPERLFFKIGEVAQFVDLKPYVLRYWESEFEFLNPTKSRNGQRVYTRKDVEIVFLIRKLLHKDKFSIEGARAAIQRYGLNIQTPLIAAAPVTAELTAIEASEADTVEAEPVTAEPAEVEPATIEPATIEPAAIEPVAIEPVEAKPFAVEPVEVEALHEKVMLQEDVTVAVEPTPIESAELTTTLEYDEAAVHADADATTDVPADSDLQADVALPADVAVPSGAAAQTDATVQVSASESEVAIVESDSFEVPLPTTHIRQNPIHEGGNAPFKRREATDEIAHSSEPAANASIHAEALHQDSPNGRPETSRADNMDNTAPSARDTTPTEHEAHHTPHETSRSDDVGVDVTEARDLTAELMRPALQQLLTRVQSLKQSLNSTTPS